MKGLLIFLLITVSQFSHAESFSIETTVTEVMGYAKTTDYIANQCLVYISDTNTSACYHKNILVINRDKSIGAFMCSVALTAQVSGKRIKIASSDEVCDSIHGAPIARYISIIN